MQEFGDRVTYDLKGFIESLVKQMEDKKAQLQELQAQEKSSSEKQNKLAETLGTLSQSIKHSEEKCEELRTANEKQKEKEAKLYDKLHGLLADVTVPFTHAHLSNYALQVEEILGAKSARRRTIKKRALGIPTRSCLK